MTIENTEKRANSKY